MSKGKDDNFDGSYASSRYADRSVEQDILRAMDGKITVEDENGNLVKIDLDKDRVDQFVKGEPGKYGHIWNDESTGDRGYHDGEGNTKSCYLTTACLKHLSEQFDDNCRELTILRWFRDRFVKPSDISLYYSVAPRIIEAIETLPIIEQDRIYASIYQDIVEPCVALIENKQFDEAYNRYLSSTLSLQKTVLGAVS